MQFTDSYLNQLSRRHTPCNFLFNLCKHISVVSIYKPKRMGHALMGRSGEIHPLNKCRGAPTPYFVYTHLVLSLCVTLALTLLSLAE